MFTRELTMVRACRILGIFLMISIIFFSACKDDDSLEKDEIDYDSSKPIKLDLVYPDSGKYLEKVMITGENFGTDPKQIRVWFNGRKAAVVGSTGSRMYVLAPRLPGDTCAISVAIGK